MGNILQAVVVLLLVTTVRSMINFGYSECIYNSYEAVCMGNFELKNYANQRLTKFPAIQRGVTCLKLKQNAISRFPDDLNALVDIVTLDLARNEIKALPNDLDKMINLEILDVSENMMEMLSPNVRFPVSLRGLLLSNNRMKTIPSGVRVPGLFVLDLSHNEFVELPEHFCMSDQLIRVDFTHNPLRGGVAAHIETVDKCRNAHEVPFCLFTDTTSIKCDCSNVGPLLVGTPSYCLGTPERTQEISCKSSSEDEYKGKILFDVNATMVQHACPVIVSSSENSASQVHTNNITMFTGIALMSWFCILSLA